MATTFVQQRAANPGSDPVALAYNSNVTAGNMLFAVVVVSDGTTPTVSGITDSLGNTWTKVVGTSAGSFREEVWKAACGSSGANTVTVDYSSSPANTGILVISEFSGMGTTTDGASNTSDVGVAADPLPCATLTTTGAGVIFCAVRMDNAFNITTWNDSFNASGVGTRSTAAYRVTATGVSAAPAIDCTTTEAGESLTVVVYEEVIGGGGFVPFPRPRGLSGGMHALSGGMN